MKRLALALLGSFPLVALAGNPVSVHPPAAKPAGSMSQSLSSVVQSAATTLPPAPVMTSSPSWGSPAVLPGSVVGSTGSCAPCDVGGTCGSVRPYFNPLALRPGCGDVIRVSCLDRIKDWFCYRPTPGGFGGGPVPYQAPLRTYFPCPPSVGCDAGGCASGACGVGRSAGGCGTVQLPVRKLEAGCDTAVCRPRVRYLPLTCRAEVPVVGCDARPARPRLFDRLFGFFSPRWGAMCGDPTCGTDACGSAPTYSPMTVTTPMAPVTPITPPAVPSTMPGTLIPPMSTTPIYGPTGRMSGKPVSVSPVVPFTNP